MPFLQLRDSRYPLRLGENRVGWGPEAEISLPEWEGGRGGAQAIVSLSGTGTATVAARGSGDAVFLNGVPVVDPAPLLHGDRLDVGPCELRFGDEAQLGETVALERGQDDAIAVPSPSARASRSGGRLLSLVDGREYAVPGRGLSIGRDPSCDIVVSAPDVSRKHALILPGETGYTLHDTSANGVFVNEARVQAELPLGRGDKIRVGRDEFRFYAEDRAAADTPSIPSLQHTGTFAAAKRGGLSQEAAPPPPRPAPEVPPRARPAFGYLEVINEGPWKGRRYELESPRIHVGRGEHNDVAIPDESVSEYHAKLLRRDDAWYLQDLDSTNGTYVGGVRIADEVVLPSGSDVRFGGVKLVFHAATALARPSGETRVIVGVKGSDPRRSQPRLKAVPDPATPAEGEESRTSPILWLIVMVLLILVAYFVIQGGAS
jgi:pSer/pThr/pTyr-binding forkhead associated (FHA) protein